MYFNRWATFSASALLQVSCSGITYVFSIIAPLFKERFGLDEIQVATIGSLGFNLGGYLAIMSGALYNSISGKNHVAPRLVIWIGVAMMIIGYGGMYGCDQGWFQPSFSTLLFFAFFAGNAGTWFDTSALVTNVRNFPDDRGTVVGILKAFLGLTGTLYASVYSSTFQPNIPSFLLFLSIVPPAFAVFLSIFINLVPKVYHEPAISIETADSMALENLPEADVATAATQPPPERILLPDVGSVPRHRFPRVHKATRFLIVYMLVAVIALYGMISSIWSSKHHMDSDLRQTITAVLLALLSAMMLVPFAVGPCTFPRRRHAKDEEADSNTPLLLHDQEDGAAAADGSRPRGQSSTTGLKPARSSSGFSEFEDEDANETLPPTELGPLQAISTKAFWLIFYSYGIGVGTGLVLLNNLASIVLALGGEKGGQVVFVALFSVANASGRLINGYASEYFLHKYGTNRTNFLSAVAALTTVAAVFGYFASAVGDLYSLSLLGGLAFGGFWSAIPAIVSDVFGLASFAANYTVLQLAPACGGYILATVLSSYEYKQASKAQGGDGRYCEGRECYTMTWTILIVLNLISLCGSRYLVWITQDTYKHMEART